MATTRLKAFGVRVNAELEAKAAALRARRIAEGLPVFPEGLDDADAEE